MPRRRRKRKSVTGEHSVRNAIGQRARRYAVLERNADHHTGAVEDCRETKPSLAPERKPRPAGRFRRTPTAALPIATSCVHRTPAVRQPPTVRAVVCEVVLSSGARE
jgi:hypothetical protein